jgi:hypothetical protein
VPASTSSIEGVPSRLTRRYVTASVASWSVAPNKCTINGARGQHVALTTTPMAAASHRPSMPWRIACLMSPAPSRRATAAVVAYARNTHRPTRADRAALATPRAPSAGSGMWPTMTESVSRKSGSATRAPNAGTASLRISLSCARRCRMFRPVPVVRGMTLFCGLRCHAGSVSPYRGDFLSSTAGGHRCRWSEGVFGSEDGLVHRTFPRVFPGVGAGLHTLSTALSTDQLAPAQTGEETGGPG